MSEIKAPALFRQDVGIVGFGAYVRSDEPFVTEGELIVSNASDDIGTSFRKKCGRGLWVALGAWVELPCVDGLSLVSDAKCVLTLELDAAVYVAGTTLGAVTFPYLVDNPVREAWDTKTSLYIPQTFYHDPVADAVAFGITVGELAGEGLPLAYKSCNRCARFLPIDIQNERNTISYSNHCVSKAPCKHAGFSRFQILEDAAGKAANSAGFPIEVVDGKPLLVAHYGFQLECRSCKKFFVNAPLNPLRNSTQHREDSLRRRALEVLVNSLLEREWIYHKHRLRTGSEFDRDIYDKFGHKCFNCQADLPTCGDMDLDHTMPLAYLWPLDETATCLCSSCNSSKSDMFPVDFYSEEQLEALEGITGLDSELTRSHQINSVAVDKLAERIEWFFDEFLMDDDYQKVRDGKLTADLIYHAIRNVMRPSGDDRDLIRLYHERSGNLPKSVTVGDA